MTELSEVGEFDLISQLTKDFKIENKSTQKGIGDDAAVLSYSDQVLVSTDMLVEGVHFDLAYVPLKHLGYKAAVSNFSDVYAMNGIAKQITVSLAVSSRFPLEALIELYQGIRLACEQYGVDLIGGDTSSSTKGMMISITVLGEAKQADVVYRNTAQTNDIVCVTGDLGAAYMGLQLLEREKNIFHAAPEIQPKLEGYDYILQRQLKPEARLDVIEMFAEIGVKPHAMIDISDGLSSEILHICKQSEKGCKLYEEKIPVAPETIRMAEELNMDPVVAAMNGGEDDELLFTISEPDFQKIKQSADITAIGYIAEASAGVDLIAMDGVEVPIVAQGWNTMQHK